MNRSFWAAVALAVLGLGPVACSSEPPDADLTEPGTQSAAVEPDAPEGVEVNDGRLTLPAVSGNPGAVYFTITNAGDVDLVVRSAAVAGAEMATLHQSTEATGQTQMKGMSEVAVPAGEEVAFAPGGLHVMATGLSENIKQGGVTEVTLTFASGDKVSFPAAIVAPGDLGEED